MLRRLSKCLLTVLKGSKTSFTPPFNVSSHRENGKPSFCVVKLAVSVGGKLLLKGSMNIFNYLVGAGSSKPSKKASSGTSHPLIRMLSISQPLRPTELSVDMRNLNCTSLPA